MIIFSFNQKIQRQVFEAYSRLIQELKCKERTVGPETHHSSFDDD